MFPALEFMLSTGLGCVQEAVLGSKWLVVFFQNIFKKIKPYYWDFFLEYMDYFLQKTQLYKAKYSKYLLFWRNIENPKGDVLYKYLIISQLHFKKTQTKSW